MIDFKLTETAFVNMELCFVLCERTSYPDTVCQGSPGSVAAVLLTENKQG